MKLSVICAGLSNLYDESADSKASGFFRMPRISMARNSQQFLPDYALLLLVDELVMARHTFEGLVRGQIDSSSTVPLMLKQLHDHGFIRLEDFDGTIREHVPQMEAMVQEQLSQLDTWIPAMRQSVQSWQSYFEGLQLTLRPRIERFKQEVAAGRPVPLNYGRPAAVFLHHMGGRYQMVRYYAEEILGAAETEPDDKNLAERVKYLTEQLTFLHANLLLAHKYSAAIHDWCDFDAHYRELISRANGLIPPTSAQPRDVFQISLPEFVLWNPDNILRALTDQRVEALRERVRESILGNAVFDVEAAGKILDAVGELEPGVGKVRLVTASLLPAPGFAAEMNTGDTEIVPALPPFVQFNSHSIDAPLADQKRAESKSVGAGAAV